MLESDVQLSLFSLSSKWYVLVTSKCHENKASITYVQFEGEKNQPFEGLERFRNHTLIRNRHDAEIIFSFLCQSDLGSPRSLSPCVLCPQGKHFRQSF